MGEVEEREWDGYRNAREFEHLRRVGTAIAGKRGRLSRDEMRALQELLVAAAGGRNQAERLLASHSRFRRGIRDPERPDAPASVFPIDGRMGPRTRLLLREAENADRIWDLQERLKRAGFYRGPLDGIPGRQTLAALAQAYDPDRLGDAKFREIFGVDRTPSAAAPVAGLRSDLRPDASAVRRPEGVEVPTAGQREGEGRRDRAYARLSGRTARAPSVAVVRMGDSAAGDVVIVGGAARPLTMPRQLAERLAVRGSMESLLREVLRGQPVDATGEALATALGGIRGFILTETSRRDFVDAVDRFRRDVQRGSTAAVEIPAYQSALQGLNAIMGGSPLRLHTAIGACLQGADQEREAGGRAPMGRALRRGPTSTSAEGRGAASMAVPGRGTGGRDWEWQREANAREVVHIQEVWRRTFPEGAPAPLCDARMLLAVFSNESDMGRSLRTGSYHGWFQLSIDPAKDTFASDVVLGRVAARLNAMAAHDPQVMQVNGRMIGNWTPALVRQHFSRNSYIQTVGYLECAMRHQELFHINLAGLGRERQAALLYMSHVLPAAASVIASNRESGLTLAALAPRLGYYMRQNPSVFHGGRLSPMATLDTWVRTRMHPIARQFGHLIEPPSRIGGGLASWPASPSM